MTLSELKEFIETEARRLGLTVDEVLELSIRILKRR